MTETNHEATPKEGKMHDRRYFYEDALSAAWMQKHFGMQFHDGTLEEVLWPWDYVLDQGTDEKACRFYVHPDSLHLFQPQIGGVATHLGQLFHKLADFVGEKIYMTSGMHCRRDDELRIIQRNDVAFHWPSSEVAESLSA